jgi:hypothetical protein
LQEKPQNPAELKQCLAASKRDLELALSVNDAPMLSKIDESRAMAPRLYNLVCHILQEQVVQAGRGVGRGA